MSRSRITRRIEQVRERIPTGCPACRTPPPIVILHDDEPDPPMSCSQCGLPYSGVRVIRITRVERGPQ